MTLREMRRRRWRLAQDIKTTAGRTFPRGTVVLVEAKRNGLTVATAECPHCRNSFTLFGIDAQDVEEDRS
jgi:hypothetical protein